eukprot:NODE_237_length_13348_cov_0.297381.p4 type:complete len:294 gc:universal NODE_237_length_13348_cov_0.297381:11590-10709(-)
MIKNPFKETEYKKLPVSTVWRRILAEFIGTLLFIYAVSASAVVPKQYMNTDAGTAALVTAFTQGLALVAIVSTFSGISGGHFNPAISLVLAIKRSISPAICILYILTQLVAAIVGAALFRGSVGKWQSLSATTLGPDITDGQGFLLEFMITSILLFVVVCTTGKNGIILAPISIGFSVVVGVLISKELTGASMNPARSFGPSVVSGVWTNQWVYWVAPICSAIVVGTLFKGIFCTDYNQRKLSSETLTRKPSSQHSYYGENPKTNDIAGDTEQSQEFSGHPGQANSYAAENRA